MPFWAAFGRAAGSGSLGLGSVALGRVLGVLWRPLGWGSSTRSALGSGRDVLGLGCGSNIDNRKPDAGLASGSGSVVLGVPPLGAGAGTTRRKSHRGRAGRRRSSRRHRYSRRE